TNVTRVGTTWATEPTRVSAGTTIECGATRLAIGPLVRAPDNRVDGPQAAAGWSGPPPRPLHRAGRPEPPPDLPPLVAPAEPDPPPVVTPVGLLGVLASMAIGAAM